VEQTVEQTMEQTTENQAVERVESIKSSKRSNARRPARSRRRLGDLCVLYDVHYRQEEAHGASYDAERLILCMAKHLEFWSSARERQTNTRT
jgi:hypothetical protein